jgi:hypothetical protein
VLHRPRTCLVEGGRRSDLSLITQACLPRSDHDTSGAVAVYVDEVREGRVGLDMPRLPFNHHAAVRASAHKDDRWYRERGGEAKLAPHPYRHESPVAHGTGARSLSRAGDRFWAGDRFSSSLRARSAG